MTYRYSNKAERVIQDIYDDIKLKKPFGLHGLYKHMSALYEIKRFSGCVLSVLIN